MPPTPSEGPRTFVENPDLEREATAERVDHDLVRVRSARTGGRRRVRRTRSFACMVRAFALIGLLMALGMASEDGGQQATFNDVVATVVGLLSALALVRVGWAAVVTDDDGIVVRNPLRTRRIGWDRIERFDPREPPGSMGYGTVVLDDAEVVVLRALPGTRPTPDDVDPSGFRHLADLNRELAARRLGVPADEVGVLAPDTPIRGPLGGAFVAREASTAARLGGLRERSVALAASLVVASGMAWTLRTRDGRPVAVASDRGTLERVAIAAQRAGQDGAGFLPAFVATETLRDRRYPLAVALERAGIRDPLYAGERAGLPPDDRRPVLVLPDSTRRSLHLTVRRAAPEPRQGGWIDAYVPTTGPITYVDAP